MKKLIPGLTLVTIIAIIAWLLGQQFTIIGAPIFGIILGMIGGIFLKQTIYKPGIKFSSKKILQFSIILIGFDMNLYNIFKVGLQSLSVIIFTLSAAFITAYFLGKKLKINPHTTTLIGVGTAICGGSAIAATAPVIKADDKEIAYGISTIFLFNIIAVFVFPFLGHILHMSDAGFGMWSGTAINDTSSVVAASYTYSNAAGNFAVVVKLTRTLMIIPITLFLAIYTSKKSNTEQHYSIIKIFPWFIIGFILASIISTFTGLPDTIQNHLVIAGKFFIVMAMVAIGLNTHFKDMINKGYKPILLGFSTWLAVGLTSLIVQYFMQLL